ncbi:SDR family oxidoreductase [Microbacterium sp. UBA3394]|uniref:SDR family NAD(P)-dependent oxidoreductase n=1 Tax=Microbacterium sp. UBA3394 TaxID=1946945 RepID=UPI000C4B504C|nr:SDR family oxidoreductase [Microbacterium sp. UBA3394]MAM54540.1 short-chain dehydrogenase [Microbacterium sp.]|tara:strand:- start:483 stop:1244 length:762 start_codon:yes stop_codon:yes gene_type:complete
MVTALITGASSGLGAEYARQLAARGADLVLVARDLEALDAVAEAIRACHRVEVEVISADLAVSDEVDRVVARLTAADAPVELLVNNAGFGLPLDFAANDVAREVDHLRVHVEAPLRLCHAALEGMLARGHGRIVNVASVAAYLPRSTYGACKRWLVDFSRWANAAYAARGVTVTAVCPGFTHTGFHERMGLAPGREGVPGWMWLDAREVVTASLRAAAKGRGVSIPSFRYRALARVAALLPASLGASVGTRGR